LVGVRGLAAGALVAEPEPAVDQAAPPRVKRTLLVVAIVVAIAAVGLSVYVAGHLYIPEDAAFERDVQAVDWGPLTITFQFFSWIGDAKGFVAEVIVFVAILVLNRRAWLFAVLAALTAVWYQVGINLVHRPRPTTAQVLRVTEHPGASSYPSGHTIFVVTLAVVLMVCLGNRFLPPRARFLGWALVALIVAANAIARMYTGAHWPTDVLAGILIAVAWLSFVGAVTASRVRRPAPSASPIRESPAAQGEG
jgi:membrane-associated phospholipid phosphatase